MDRKKYKFVFLNDSDSVAVCLEDIPAGAVVPVITNNGPLEVELKDSIKFGHKFAVRKIDKGHEIFKYGEIIGTATEDIEVGQHVHIHNLEGIRGRGDKLAKQ
ncbi:UxaA family hydrolase [Sediminibacillus massiliensis]|uniref:UxaA family hydrolase n=1 Tax=Sediminibacillus massiliensis TaxID=1926277 RepID=UPI0009883881|nr:UxaA family hydrolase [Sediminibacillus massiliensis]